MQNKFAKFFDSAIVDGASSFGALGLYLGQLAFRYKGHGRLSHNAYVSRTGLEQILYVVAVWILLKIPQLLNEFSKQHRLTIWPRSILIVAIPSFILYYMITFLLPILTIHILKYPLAKQDEDIHVYLA